MNRAAREQAERDAIRREFWARVLLKNGCVPPHAYPVDEEDERPPVWLGVILIIVAVAMVVAVIYLGSMAVS